MFEMNVDNLFPYFVQYFKEKNVDGIEAFMKNFEIANIAMGRSDLICIES